MKSRGVFTLLVSVVLASGVCRLPLAAAGTTANFYDSQAKGNDFNGTNSYPAVNGDGTETCKSRIAW